MFTTWTDSSGYTWLEEPEPGLGTRVVARVEPNRDDMASLFEAAPDLLEALLPFAVRKNTTQVDVDRALAAIAKAWDEVIERTPREIRKSCLK